MACLFIIYIPCEDPDENISHIPYIDTPKIDERTNFTIEKSKNKENEKSTMSLPSQKMEGTASVLSKSDSSNPIIAEKQPFLGVSKNDVNFNIGSSSNNNSNQKLEPSTLEKKRFHVSLASERTANETALLNRKASEANFKSNFIDQEQDEPIEVITLAKYLIEQLSFLEIDNDIWIKNANQTEWQISFIVPQNPYLVQKIFKTLHRSGFGRLNQTSLSFFETNHHYMVSQKDAYREKKKKDKSMKSWLQVSEIIGSITRNAHLTRDFVVLILLAGIIAGFGLVENSSVVLVASMLISPLMGPIIGFTFGVFTENKPLRAISLQTELIGLLLCLLYGFVFGIICGSIYNGGSYWGADVSWPTSEMKSRGQLRSLLIGMLIALPSGAGVALSILEKNTGSLVGVAISASLLPPAVNAGLLWGFSFISLVINLPAFNIDPLKNYTYIPPDCPPLVGNEYEFIYSCEMPKEAAILAAISLLLTIINIICIFIMGAIVMRIKEVSPIKSDPFSKKEIVNDVRKSCKTLKGRDQVKLAKQFYEEKNKIGQEKYFETDDDLSNEQEENILIAGHQYITLNANNYTQMKKFQETNQLTMNNGEKKKGCVLVMGGLKRGVSSPNSVSVMFDVTKLNDCLSPNKEKYIDSHPLQLKITSSDDEDV